MLVAQRSVADDAVLVSWTTSVPPRVNGLFDLVSGCIARRATAANPQAPGCLWQDRGVSAAICLADDQGLLSFPDVRAIDPDTLGFYYLVREQSACGITGSYGSDSLGRERLIGGLDCAR